MKAQKCILIVNTRNGYCFTPKECNSISEAVREGRDSCGFTYRIIVKGKGVVRSGYCD